MKNIHILPTDKPSKLHIAKNGDLHYSYEDVLHLVSANDRPHSMYITSDEEIKEGDWFYNPHINEIQINCNSIDCKKITLTTDQDLIKDGVQAIGDKFLEWFVNNSSCEEAKQRAENYMKLKGTLDVKEESIKEAAEKYSEELLEAKTIQAHEKTWIKAMFIWVAEWKAKRMYSENEVKGMLYAVGNAMRYKGVNYHAYFNYKNVQVEVDKVLKQFKKK